ncbi:MAG: hypothetical protein AB1725_11370 [Armatimonadota bacterium]
MSAGSENKVTAWLQGAKDALPVVVVLVGGWGALRLAPTLSGFAAGQDARPVPAVSPWDESLVGRQVELPTVDLNGRPVDARQGTVVVSVSCTDCASPEALLSIASKSPVKPVVFVSAEFTEPYRAVLDAAPDVRLVQFTSESPVVPPEMLLKAPQAVVLDAQGVVAAVPRKEETLKMFFERLGGQK